MQSEKRQRLDPSWLALREHLPIRDVRKYLFKWLDACDFFMVQLAHGCTPPKDRIKVASAMIRNEYTRLLPLLGSVESVTCYVEHIAPVLGKVSVLEWLQVFAPGHLYNLAEIVSDAARHGQVSVLEWVGYRGKFTIPITTAAINSHEISPLKWLFAHDELSHYERLSILQRCCIVGTRGGYIPLLEFVLHNATAGGFEHAAKMLFQTSIMCDNIKSFKWLTENILIRPAIHFPASAAEFRALYQ